MDRAETGRTGEAVAARYYQKQGCELVAHNYRTRMGEIDLILREPDGTLVLCEVKTRSPDPLAAPAAAVTPAKQRRLIRTAEYYLQHTGQSDEPVRFDVAEVTPLDSGRWMVHIIKGAFTAYCGVHRWEKAENGFCRCRKHGANAGLAGKKERRQCSFSAREIITAW